MINNLIIKNFKGLAEASLPFQSLVVLTGVNGGGKSTVIQSLIMLRQLGENADENRTIQLNDYRGIQLGEANEVLHAGSEEADIHFEINSFHNRTLAVDMAVLPGRSLFLAADSASSSSDWRTALGGNQFTNLIAERYGPRDTLGVYPGTQQSLNVGYAGEYVAHALSVFERKSVANKILHHPQTEERGNITTLRKQTENWLGDIVGPIEVNAQWISGTNSTSLRFKKPGWNMEWLRPTNVGFGVSYAIPVIVAGLLAEPNGIMIVENPESHLHPAGQSKIGAFLCRVAASGTQVIVETHSDHVLNGIRLAIAAEKILLAENVSLLFSDGGSGGSNTFSKLSLDQQGNIDSWPKGFFDQTEFDLGKISRAKRGA